MPGFRLPIFNAGLRRSLPSGRKGQSERRVQRLMQRCRCRRGNHEERRGGDQKREEQGLACGREDVMEEDPERLLKEAEERRDRKRWRCPPRGVGHRPAFLL